MYDEFSSPLLENHWAAYLYQIFFDRLPMTLGRSLSREAIASMSTFSFTLINTRTGEQTGMQVHVVRPEDRPARAFNWFELIREQAAEKIFSESHGTILLVALRTAQSAPTFVASGPGGLLSLDSWSFLAASVVPVQLLSHLRRVRINAPQEAQCSEMLFAFPFSADHATEVTCDAGECGTIACTAQAHIANERMILGPNVAFSFEASEPIAEVAIRVTPDIDEPHSLRIASAPNVHNTNVDAQWLRGGDRLAIHLCERPSTNPDSSAVHQATASRSGGVPSKNADETHQPRDPVTLRPGDEREPTSSSSPRMPLCRSEDPARDSPPAEAVDALETTVLSRPEIDETVKLSRAEVLRTIESAADTTPPSSPDEP